MLSPRFMLSVLIIAITAGNLIGQLIDARDEQIAQHIPPLAQLPAGPSLPPTRPPSQTGADEEMDEEDGEESAHELQSSLNFQDYYALLGIGAQFTPHELRKAYRQASLRLHPDKPAGSEVAFQVEVSLQC